VPVPILTSGSNIASLQGVSAVGSSPGYLVPAWLSAPQPHPAAVLAEARVAVADETDIVTARQKGRELAADSGFPAAEQTLIAAAITEIARNIIAYAERGELVLARLELRGRRGLLVVARDAGPGIADVSRAMAAAGSVGRSLSKGLPGAKYLMDEFELVSTVGKGTTVTLRKWVR